jgi:hypothetical protein
MTRSSVIYSIHPSVDTDDGGDYSGRRPAAEWCLRPVVVIPNDSCVEADTSACPAQAMCTDVLTKTDERKAEKGKP